MSKQYKIRWTESDLTELEKAVRNFNAKVNRLTKSNPQIKNALPERVQVSHIKELINTRNDLRREINTLRRFSKRGAEEIVNVPGSDYNTKITRWQRTEMNRRISVINRRRAKRLEELASTEQKSRGESLGYTKAQIGMGKPELVALEPMNAFYRTMGYEDVKQRWKSIVSQSQSDYYTKKDYQVRENYIKGIETNYDVENVQDIIDYIKSLDIKDFMKVFNEEGATFEIVSPKGKSNQAIKMSEYESYETALRSTWLPNKREETENTNISNDVELRDYSSDLSVLESIVDINGYIAVYSDEEKVGRFKSGKDAYKYIKKNKLNNITYNIEK